MSRNRSGQRSPSSVFAGIYLRHVSPYFHADLGPIAYRSGLRAC